MLPDDGMAHRQIIWLDLLFLLCQTWERRKRGGEREIEEGEEGERESERERDRAREGERSREGEREREREAERERERRN